MTDGGEEGQVLGFTFSSHDPHGMTQRDILNFAQHLFWLLQDFTFLYTIEGEERDLLNIWTGSQNFVHAFPVERLTIIELHNPNIFERSRGI